MLTAPTTIATLLRRPAAIFGGGRSGLAVRELLQRVGAESVLYDERGADGQCKRKHENGSTRPPPAARGGVRVHLVFPLS